MGKQDTKQDMFGIGDEDTNDGPEYVIAQIIPADGWRAVFQEPNGQPRVCGLACFALVEIIPEDPNVAQIPQRAIRPMVVDEFGEVEDVGSFEDFVCVVQPGQAIESTVAYVIKRRDIIEKTAK